MLSPLDALREYPVGRWGRRQPSHFWLRDLGCGWVERTGQPLAFWRYHRRGLPATMGKGSMCKWIDSIGGRRALELRRSPPFANITTTHAHVPLASSSNPSHVVPLNDHFPSSAFVTLIFHIRGSPLAIIVILLLFSFLFSYLLFLKHLACI